MLAEELIDFMRSEGILCDFVCGGGRKEKA